MRSERARRAPTALEDFCLPSTDGMVCLHDTLAGGPALVWVHRGAGCGDCRRGLRMLRDGADALRTAGIDVLVVSSDTRDEARAHAEADRLPFMMLSDPRGTVARAVDARAGADVRPAALLLDRRARVRWSHVGRDASDQPDVPALLATVRRRAPLPVPSPSDVLKPRLVAAIVAVFAALGVIAAFANGSLLFFDEPLADAIRAPDAAWYGTLWRWTTDLGSRIVLGALTVVLATIAWRRCKQIAVSLILALPVAFAVELILKALVDRPRPPAAEGFGASFPSGHVIAAVAFWGLVPAWTYLMTYRRPAWLASVVVATIAIGGVAVSRVYLGAHWPSDTVAGVLGGSIFLLGAEFVLRRPWRSLRCDACEFHPLRSPRAVAGAKPSRRTSIMHRPV